MVKETAYSSTWPDMGTWSMSLIRELNSLKDKGLVSGRKNEDFYDCELGVREDEVDGINLEENENQNTQYE